MVDQVSLRILSLIPGLIPGIEQVILVHSPQHSTDLSGFLLKKDAETYKTEPIKLEAGSSFFISLTAGSQTYKWFQKEQVPFDVINKNKIQLTIFNELKNNILLVKHVFPGATSCDLIFIYFNENLSNFVLDKVSEPFSAQHKNIVGYLLSHSIQTVYQLTDSQNKLTSTFDDQIKLVVKERDFLRESLELQSQQERQGVVRLSEYYLAQIAESYGKRAILTDSAKIKLKSYEGELYLLEGIIRDALEFAGALSSSSRVSSVLIADYHIRFPDPSEIRTSEEFIEGLPQRLIKTHLLLDRLEMAASGIKQKKNNLTSANVGKEFPTPVSAPAITDALRKHRKRIIQLFDQYPDKWEIIRHEFRPIQNLLNSVQNQELLSA